MRNKGPLVLLAALICSIASGQTKITLHFSTESPRVLFSSPEWPSSLPQDASLQTGKEAEFGLGTVGANDFLVVWERDSNNAAIRKVKDVKADWLVSALDFSAIGKVRLRVEHEGKPVAAAQVSMTDKSRTMTELIDPSSKGEVEFFGVQPGEVKVAVKVRANGKTVVEKQGFELSLKRDSVIPSLIVSVPEGVETLSPEAPKPSSSGPAAAPSAGSEKNAKSPRSQLGALLSFALVLVVVGVVAFVLLKAVKNNNNQISTQLKNLGVALPDPTPPGAQPGAPVPGQAAPEPIQKIILDDAAPTPLAGQLAAAATIAAGPREPRLRRDDGQLSTLVEGETIVGRDDGLGLSLAGEGSVSRRHASLVRQGDKVTLKDLGSTNGTYVNGQKLTGEQPLQPGDSLQFGQVRYRFEI